MHLLCPHCQNPIELLNLKDSKEILCPSCGSTIRLEDGSTTGWQPLEGRKLGRFELIDTIGAGAFGTVYRARDPDLDRTVAIKVPRAGNLTGPQDLDRFLREARSVAQLQHPSIVAIHEVSQADGVPYLVSDLVEGITLADMLSGRRLPPRDAAELVARVAEAIQYAHDRGVIHRDIKPSNIMLNANGAPIVMDFGLAKRDAGEITMTMDGQVLGTPAYMSPEQARGEGHGVDGRSDVYSLGVVLYHLLTGELPFRGNSRMLLHQVLHDEPRPPRSLNDRIPRDLETVTLKAMAKEPARRYPTARALAEDLHRYRAGEPILARPTGRIEKWWRVCRRNPGVAGLTAALLLALVTGTVISTVLWLRARASYREVVAERGRADENFREALRAVDEYYTKITENQLLDSKLPGMQPLRKELLTTALRYYQRFADKRADDPAVRLELAKAYSRMGMITATVGAQDEGLRMLEKSRDLLLDLDRERPGDAEVRQPLAKAYRYLSDMQKKIGRTTAAVETARQSVSLNRELLAKAPLDADRQKEMTSSLYDLGDALDRIDRANEALLAFREAIDLLQQLVRDHPGETGYINELAGMHHNCGQVYQDRLGKGQEALAEFSQALALEEQAAAKAPYDIWVQDYMAKHLYCLGVVYDESFKQRKEALEYFQRSAAVREKTVRENPTVHEFRGDLAFVYRGIGRMQRIVGDKELAAKSFDRALRLLETLVAEQPAVADYRRTLALTYTSLGNLFKESGEIAETIRCHKRAVAVQQELVRDDPAFLQNQWYLAIYLANLGSDYALVDMLDDARRSVAPVTPIVTELQRLAFKDSDFSTDFGKRFQGLIANVNARFDKAEQELRQLEKTLAEEQARLPVESPSVAARYGLIKLQSSCAVRSQKLGLKEEALRFVGDALRLLDDLVKERPDDPVYPADRLLALSFRARACSDLGRPAEALRAARSALAAWAPQLAEQPNRLVELAVARVQCSALLGEGRASLTEVETAERRRLEDQAMDALRDAAAKGLRNPQALRTNPEFDPLRPRDDFKTLVRELDVKAKKPDAERQTDSGIKPKE